MSQPAGQADVQSTTTLRLCPACDYDLRRIQSSNCPECGLAIGDTPALKIPWEERKEIGRLRAFCKTVYLVVFQPARFAVAVGWPMDVTSAYLFRLWVTILAAMPPTLILLGMTWHEGGTGVLALTSGVRLYDDGSPRMLQELLIAWSAGATLLPVILVAALLAMWLITGSARYWYSSKKLETPRRGRVTTISHYACAPLAWVPIPAATFAMAIWLSPDHDPGRASRVLPVFLLAVSIATGAILIIAWWWRTVYLLQRAMRCGWARCLAAAFGLPIRWAVSLAVGLVLWPIVAGLIWIAIDGFRK